MLILSRVCAEFRNPRGETVFRVTPANHLTFLEAPEEIQSDPLFRMLLEEGSLEAVQSVDRKKKLENDPTSGTDATGKRMERQPGGLSVEDGTGKPAETEEPAQGAPSFEGELSPEATEGITPEPARPRSARTAKKS